MNLPPIHDDEFNELLDQLIDGELSSDQFARLESALLGSAEHRAAYRDLMRVHASLAWPRRWQSDESLSPLTAASEATPSDRAGFPERQPTLRKSRKSITIRWLLVVAAIAATGLVMFAVSRKEHLAKDFATHSVVEEPDERPIAVISEAIGVSWANDAPWKLGQALLPGELKFETGLVQLDFASGARLICRGPAVLDLISAQCVRIHSGEATCYVGELGKGFQVLTGQSEVIDLGTSFGIRVQADGQSEVHVFEGAVAVRQQANSDAVEFTENSAVRVSSQEIVGTTYSEKGFPRFEEVEAQRDEQWRLRHAAWKQQSEQLSGDPDVMVHYTFDDDQSGGIELVNQSVSSARGTNGAILRAKWCQGRWPDKRGLQFTQPTDRVLLKIPGSYEELSFVIWARPDAFLQETTALLLSEHPSRWRMHGTLSNQELNQTQAPKDVFRWVLNNVGDARISMAYQDQPPSSYQLVHHGSGHVVPEEERVGHWTCYGVTLDPTRMQVSHYFNGQCVRVSAMSQSVALPLETLEIGNLSPTTEEQRNDESYRFFGAIDEVMIAKRAFSSREMQSIYEIGRRSAED